MVTLILAGRLLIKLCIIFEANRPWIDANINRMLWMVFELKSIPTFYRSVYLKQKVILSITGNNIVGVDRLAVRTYCCARKSLSGLHAACRDAMQGANANLSHALQMPTLCHV